MNTSARSSSGDGSRHSLASSMTPPALGTASRFHIAYGTHRGKAKNDLWTAKKLWDRLNKPLIDTEISWAKYLNLGPSKEDQSLKSRLKAKPGWFKMGHYKNGRRKHENLLGVSAISLDLDSVTQAQIDHIRMGFAPISEFVWMGHTTRSHMPEKPRWRLVLPLDRVVDLGEANAIARYLATMLADDPQEGIEMADQVSFRNNQAMYWPSICDGQPFETDRNINGKLLEVDDFLDRFPGWRDVTTLPRQDHEKSAAGADPNKRFEDPRDKPGIIGAFCRAYDIETAIAEFIPDIYTPGESSGSDVRYTYEPGSAYNGVVVYDDGQIIYSNHGTDPIQGGANAFDMVRIHKFGHLDEKAGEDESPTKLPSYKAMVEMAKKLRPVKEEITENSREKFDEDEDEGDEIAGRFDADDDEVDDDIDDFLGLGDEKPKERKEENPKKWERDLRLNMKTGAVVKSSHNVALILQNAKPFAGCIAFNEFTQKIVAKRPLNFPSLTTLARIPISDAELGREWIDTDEHDIRLALAAPKELGGWEYDVSQLDISAAVETAARQNPFHPVRERLEAVAWDAVERAETVFIDYLGVPDVPYYRETCRLFLLAAVTRIYEPGHKWDYVPILGGPQGIGKSTFFEKLALRFFGVLSNDIQNLGRMVESMLGFWIVEIGELAGLSKADVEEAKKFITDTQDTVRLAYRRNAETYRRQGVLGGTTNRNEYLKDETGNRRFWPIKCADRAIDTDKLEREAEMIWAEVLTWYRAARKKQPHGSLPLYLKDPASIAMSKRLQDESRTVTTGEMMAEEIGPWLERHHDLASIIEGGDDRFDREAAREGAKVRRTRARIRDVWKDCLGRDREPSNLDLQNLANAVRHIPGWSKEKRRLNGTRRVWLLRDGSDWQDGEWEPVEPDS